MPNASQKPRRPAGGIASARTFRVRSIQPSSKQRAAIAAPTTACRPLGTGPARLNGTSAPPKIGACEDAAGGRCLIYDGA